MFEAFAVVARELAEVLLICGTMLASLRRAGLPGLGRRVVLGALGGAVLSIPLGALLLRANTPQGVAAVLSLLFALMVMALATRALRSAGAIQDRWENWLDAWATHRHAPLWVPLVAAAVSLREGLEIVVFMRSIVTRHGEAAALLGGLLGAAAVALVWAAGRRVRAGAWVAALFRLSALLLCLLAILMLLGAVGDLATLAAGNGADGSAWLALLAPFLRGGAWHWGLVSALLALPTLRIARSWWREAAVSTRSHGT